MTKKSKISYLSDSLNDNRLISPEQTLQNVLDDIRDKTRKCTKLLVLCLDDEDCYDLGFYAANLKMSEILAMLSRMTYTANEMMD